jgi:RHS repeat-associated protein
VAGYGGETATNPQLVITYGRPAVVLNQITTIHGDGADLSWAPYTDPTPGTNPNDDLVEYQVHRSTTQAFKPLNYNLVAPVPAGTTSYSDTSATPTPDSGPASVVYYMVTAKTVGGMGPSPTQKVILPKAGFTTQVINASGATTLSQAQPATPEQHLTGQPWLAAGDNSATYGVTRTVVSFPALAGQGIPGTAVVTGAQLKLWGFSNAHTGGGPASYEAHALTQDFDPATATWNNASAGTPWATAGGAFSATAAGSVTGLTNDPAADQWPVTSTVQGWVSDPTSQHGLLVKLAAETSTSPQEQELFLDTTAPEPALRPQLVVTYLDATTENTYYVPALPEDLTTATTYTVPVTVTNNFRSALGAGDWKLSYHWYLPDGTTDVSDASNQLQTTLPADLLSGQSVTVNAQLKTPDTTTGTGDTGNIRTGYILGWDLHNTTTGLWLSGDGTGLKTIPPLNQQVSVTKPGPALLGLEKYYQYTTMATGSGSALLNNDATGNVAWSYNAFSNPSAGFATFVRLAYNSMDTSSSSMGFGWSLQASTLMRLGSPLDFHPNPQNNSATAALTDGDGTTHTFTRADATSPWVSPPGFHYFLQQDPNACDPSGHTEDSPAWTLTRPDRTQILFDCQGYQSAVIDRNGNETDFTYEDRDNSYNKPVKFLDYITDQAGRQTLTISYYRKSDATWSSYDPTTGTVKSGTGKLTNPKIEDQVKSITDISGRTITFYYTTQGLLGQMTDGDGTTQLTKVFTFGYDMTQGNKNVKLVSVTDPRGNTTGLAYYTAPADPTFKWSLQTLTDRRANPVTFGYAQASSTDPINPGGINAAVTDQAGQGGQAGHTTSYQISASGQPVQITDAKGQKTQLSWDNDNNVTSLTEDNGAKTTWTWDQNTGYPLTMTGAQANHDGTAGTTYTYNTGLSGHIADLASILTPQQRLWTFGYDANGNLTSVTDPDGNAPGATPGSYTTHYTHYTPQLPPFGELHTAQDANGNTTTYANYDPNGYPQTITDPLNHAWTYSYDARGNVLTSADPFQDTTSYSYDVFGRPGQVVVPKNHNATPPVMITIPAPVYDGNDNVKKSFDATGAETDYTQNANDQLTSKTLPPDDSAGTLRKYTYSYDLRGNLTAATEPNGNAPGATPGSYTTSYGYDNINEPTSVTDAANDQTIYGYDDVGNRTSVKDPLGHLTQQGYNLNHQPTIATDAQNNTTITHYDLDGLVDKITDQNKNTTEYTRDPRGDLIQVKAPHDPAGTVPGEAAYNYTQYVYDQDGNRTQVLTPRAIANGYSRSSACITTQTCGYTYVTRYDANNQVTAQLSAYDPTVTNSAPAETDYTYNAARRLIQVTAPASATGGPAITTFGYFDNNWVKTSTDPWNITTKYDYTDNGQQKSRTLTSADGSMSRTQGWAYWPGGPLEQVTDDGVPTGLDAELVDNSDFNNASASPDGNWAKATTGTGFVGYDYRTHAKGAGTDTFTWKVHVPVTGQYKIYVKYPPVSGAATSAPFKVTYSSGGSATTNVDQTTGAGTWVSLGEHNFSQTDTGQKITLTQSSTGIAVADAVRLVADTTGVTNTAHHQFTYGYDPTGNQKAITDGSTPAPAITAYAMTYDQVNRLTEVDENNSAGTAHKTTYAYDAASNLANRTHDGASSDFTYDSRNLLATQTDKASPSDTTPQLTQFTAYTPDQLLKTQIKPNGNTAAYTYYADQLPQHLIETTPAGAKVAEHSYGYNADGAKTSDTENLMSADPGRPTLTHTLGYTYDPRDRITKVTTDGATTETYTHDAADNVTAQTIGTTTTSFTYDRDRLMAANSGALTYNYDALGRLDTITTTVTGAPVEQNAYDGFDNLTSHTQGGTTTGYTYDPLNRMTSQTAGGTTTSYGYLGLSGDLTSETRGTTSKAYAYTPGGQRLYQYTPGTSTASPGYYTYNDHDDVEAVTGSSSATGGATTATYGYTAYGQPAPAQFTGNDKNNTQPGPGIQPYNSYRYNAMRWDASSGQYDMGFRNYAPALNQFLSRDMYNGALADMQLSTDPFTGNRYTFAAGNPITNIELDGHSFPGGGGAAGCPYGTIGCLGGPPVASGDSGSSPPASPASYDTGPGGGYCNGIVFKLGACASERGAAGTTPAQVKQSLIGAGMILLGALPIGDAIGGLLGLFKGAATVARGATTVAGDAAATAPEDASLARAAATCGGMSFTADTKVLLANGAAVPIASLKPGDKVLATNTRTGRTRAEPVTAVLVHHDTNRYNLKIKTGKGTAVIHTTTTHLFWDLTRGRWVKAKTLMHGDHLLTPGSATATVVGGYAPRARSGWMWDLTVQTDHDFYIHAAADAVLVHNCPGLWGEPDTTYQTYTKVNPDTGQVYAGRTSGWRSPLRNVAARDVVHDYNDLGFEPAVLDKSSTSEIAIRGREQQLINYYREQGISANGRNEINPDDPSYGWYLLIAAQEFGPLP